MKNYLIIGASSGIGKQLAQQLAESGNQVFATYHKNKHDNSSHIQYFSLDTREEDIDLGFLPEKLDGLVYCPGSIQLKPFHRFKDVDFINDFNLQVLGAIRVIRQALPQLKASENGSIVLFSTVAVQQGFNFHSLVATSKGAIEGLTKSLAAELSPTIRVNAIAPSLTDTPLAEKLLNNEQKRQANSERNPMKKIGTPQDIASAAQYLLSPQSSWVTGQIFHIDGGMSSIKF